MTGTTFILPNGTVHKLATNIIGYVYVTIVEELDSGWGKATGVSGFNTFDNGINFYNSKDEDTLINMYYDAAGPSGPGYYIQNLMSSPKTLRIVIVGHTVA